MVVVGASGTPRRSVVMTRYEKVGSTHLTVESKLTLVGNTLWSARWWFAGGCRDIIIYTQTTIFGKYPHKAPSVPVSASTICGNEIITSITCGRLDRQTGIYESEKTVCYMYTTGLVRSGRTAGTVDLEWLPEVTLFKFWGCCASDNCVCVGTIRQSLITGRPHTDVMACAGW